MNDTTMTEAVEQVRKALDDYWRWWDDDPPVQLRADAVKAVDAWWSDGAAWPTFAGLLTLADGCFATISGCPDYTGGEGRLDVVVDVHQDRATAVSMGLTLNNRCNMGLLLPGEEMTTPASE